VNGNTSNSTANKTPSTARKPAPSRLKSTNQQPSSPPTSNSKETMKKVEPKLMISNFSGKKNEKEVISLHSSGSSEKSKTIKKKTVDQGGLKQSSLDNFMVKNEKGKRKIETDLIIDLEDSEPQTSKKQKVMSF